MYDIEGITVSEVVVQPGSDKYECDLSFDTKDPKDLATKAFDILTMKEQYDFAEYVVDELSDNLRQDLLKYLSTYIDIKNI